MLKRWKYVALSAFVLPGLGQFCLGRRLKGGVMILLDNIFILAALYVVVRCVCKSMLPGQGQILDAGKVLAGVREDAPYAVWLLGGVLLLWVYGVVDAALDKGSGNN
jgi:hypothetical protein